MGRWARPSRPVTDSPSDPVHPIADWLRHQAETAPDRAIAVVGHLPFLDRLAAVLVVGREDAHPIRFENAGLVKLAANADASGFAVEWILTRELSV